jgi:hypothetical protein
MLLLQLGLRLLRHWNTLHLHSWDALVVCVVVHRGQGSVLVIAGILSNIEITWGIGWLSNCLGVSRSDMIAFVALVFLATRAASAFAYRFFANQFFCSIFLFEFSAATKYYYETYNEA